MLCGGGKGVGFFICERETEKSDRLTCDSPDSDTSTRIVTSATLRVAVSVELVGWGSDVLDKTRRHDGKQLFLLEA